MGKTPTRITRRSLVAGGFAAIAALLALPAEARASPAPQGDRRIRLYNIHTGESVAAVYRTPSGYVDSSLRQIDRLLRDFRTGEVHPIDPALIELVDDLHARFDTVQPFHVISGYRSPHTNGVLRANGGGVARNSLHMEGMAIDIALPGRDLGRLYDAARALGRGGVGLYRKSGFIHTDIGRPRAW